MVEDDRGRNRREWKARDNYEKLDCREGWIIFDVSMQPSWQSVCVELLSAAGRSGIVEVGTWLLRRYGGGTRFPTHPLPPFRRADPRLTVPLAITNTRQSHIQVMPKHAVVWESSVESCERPKKMQLWFQVVHIDSTSHSANHGWPAISAAAATHVAIVETLELRP